MRVINSEIFNHLGELKYGKKEGLVKERIKRLRNVM